MTERELERRAKHRMAIIRHAQEVTGNVSKTCRYYVITSPAYYKWPIQVGPKRMSTTGGPDEPELGVEQHRLGRRRAQPRAAA